MQKLWQKIPEALREAIKEFGRVIVLAIIPILISNLTEDTFNWKVVAVTAALAGLRFIDKWMHEVGMEREEKSTSKVEVVSSLTGGLTRF